MEQQVKLLIYGTVTNNSFEAERLKLQENATLRLYFSSSIYLLFDFQEQFFSISHIRAFTCIHVCPDSCAFGVIIFQFATSTKLYDLFLSKKTTDEIHDEHGCVCLDTREFNSYLQSLKMLTFLICSGVCPRI